MCINAPSICGSVAQVTKVPGIAGRQDKSLETFAVSPSGNQLAFVCDNGYIALLDIRLKHSVRRLVISSGGVCPSCDATDSAVSFRSGRSR